MPIDNDGSISQPTFEFLSEKSLGLYRSGASAIGLSYGQIQVPTGSGLQPPLAFSSESSLGLYRSGASFLAVSYGNLAFPNVLTGTAQIQFAGTNAGAKIIYADGGTQALQFQNLSNDIPFQIGMFGGTPSTISVLRHNSGAAIIPTITFASEISLGLFRSAASTLALSYGTFDFTQGGAVTSIASLKIKSGTNNSCGTAILGSNGSVNVPNTYVAAGDLIFLTDQTPGGTLGDLELGGIRAGSGFTIQSTSITDTSTVAWLIVRPT